MLNLQLDSKGSLTVRWPEGYAAILELAEAYIARESGLPEDQRVREPSLERISTLATQAEEGNSAAREAETARATGAGKYLSTMEQALPKLDKAVKSLEARYGDNPAQLEAWGLNTKQVDGEVRVYRPRSQKAWAAFLQSYVAKEKSLMSEQRITHPAFEDMSALAAAVNEGLTTRDTGLADRQIGVGERSSALPELMDQLQVAVAVLVSRSGCVVTNDLELWGVRVVEGVGGGTTAGTEPTIDAATPVEEGSAEG